MGDMDRPGHVAILEKWLKSYRPEELFDAQGQLMPELAKMAPNGERRMSTNPHENGGAFLKKLRLPDFRKYAVEVSEPGAINAEATRVQGKYLRDVMKLNLDSNISRIFSPDENNSNRWQDRRSRDGGTFRTPMSRQEPLPPGINHVAARLMQQSVARGRPLLEAILESRVVRLRPILLTAGAALLFAIPITLDPIFSGLGWALIFGLIASTLFTLFVIPVKYWLLSAGRETKASNPVTS